LLILTIDPTRVEAPVKYENIEGGSELFPHIYGDLDADAIVDVRPFPPDADGVFSLPTVAHATPNTSFERTRGR
jgi:uncharacterized protein (DUF952 family)